eukprot:5048544-Pyramimonas_sp.AAC.1
MASRRPKRLPKRSKWAPRRPPREPQHQQIVPFPWDNVHFGSSWACSLHSVQDGHTEALDGPRTAPEAPLATHG